MSALRALPPPARDLRAVAPAEFDLIEKVGAGAWGEVWRATQRQTQRTVAIKFLAGVSAPEGTRASQLAWRFQREIEAAAQQDHLHIAAIIASGVSAGQPWFAMEFVEGARLDDFAAAHPLRERLALFRRVCEGVQHAHDNGVIHRDLKPANILVRADGIPKILDFGLARFLDDAGLGHTLTLDDQPLGTPLFMAPEQAAGKTREIGVGTDVYALGVILYHLATGEWPFDATLPPLQLLAAVRDTEPRPPRGIPRDLAAIIGRAMAREKTDRYPSVRAFSEDVAHFLAGEPVAARAWTFGYVLGRRLRKHWRSAAVAVVIFALAAAYLEERHRAAARNVRSLHQAKELINTMVFELHERLQPLGMTDVLAGVTERVAQFPWDLEKDASGQLDLRRFQALAADVRGDAFASKDQKVEALAEYRTAAALLDELAREHPQNPGLLAESAAEQLAVNRMLDQLGSHDDALARSRQLLAELELRSRGPADGALAGLRLDTRRVIGQILLGRGRFTEAEAEVRAALRLAATPGGDAPSSALHIAELHIDLGNACQGLSRLSDAVAAHAEAERICRSAIAQNGANQPAREVLTRSLMGAAAAAISSGEVAPARRALDEAYAVRARLHSEGAIPALTPADFTLAAAYSDLGRTLVSQAQDALAVEALEAASQVLTAIFPKTTERTATRIKLYAVLRETAGARLRLGHQLEAARAFHEALGHSKELRKHALDDPRWLLTNLDCHIHLLSLPMVSRTPSYADRRKVIAESFAQLAAMKNVTDAQRQTAEELQARFAATPKR